MQNPKHKRHLRNYIINPRYQLRYIFWLTSSGLFLVILNAWIAYTYIKENYLTLVDLSPMTDEAKKQLYSELRQLALAITSSSALFLVVIAALGVILSHRTAGPLYAFKKAFEDIANGNSGRRLQLRPGDEFKDVAESFNKMMDRIKPKS
jgi:signal peptidase II